MKELEARVNACFSLPFLFRIKTNYNDCCKIVVKTFGSNTTNVVSLVYTKTLKINKMKALQIINKSSVEVEKMYWTPNQYDVTIKNSNGVHVFGVKLTSEGTFELFNYQFSEANQLLVDSIKPFILFEIVDVESCNEMQIAFPTEKLNNVKSLEDMIFDSKSEWVNAGCPVSTFAEEQYSDRNY